MLRKINPHHILIFLSFMLLITVSLIFKTVLIQTVNATPPSNTTKHTPVQTIDELPGGKIFMGGTTNHVYSFTGDVVINNPNQIDPHGSGAPVSNTGVIFIEGNLTIGPLTGNKLEYDNANAGLVFVVKGNVNIDQSVTQIDAVIISEGIICTAFDGTNCLDGATPTPQLTINGSIISLNQTGTCVPVTSSSCPIKFKRFLGEASTKKDSRDAAEVINYQPKYLVILRDLFSDTFQKWSEIDASTPIPTGSFSCNQYNGTEEENEKLCLLSGCKRCPGNRCMPSGGSC